MRIRLVILVMVFLALAMVVANGFIYHDQLEKYVEKDAHEHHEHEVEILSDQINSKLNEFMLVTKLLSRWEEFLRALLNRDSVSVSQANRVLDDYQSAIGADVCYLLDEDGNTLASSNRHDKNSFVGKSYAFRPYFKQAIKGGTAVYMAVGATSGKRWIYYSHPVVHPAYGRADGVVVIKMDVSQIERLLSSKQGASLVLLDPNGIVFLSNRKKWQRRLLWQLDAEAATAVIGSRQFGKGPFAWIGMVRTGPGRMRDAGGREYYIHERTISRYPGWRLLTIYDVDQDSPLVSGPMRQIILFILVPFCFLIAMVSLLVIFMVREETRSREKYQRQFLLLDALMNAVPSPIFYRDAGMVYRGCNRAFESYIGRSNKKIVGEKFSDITPKELTEIFPEEGAALSECLPLVHEKRVRYADGTHRHAILYGACLSGTDDPSMGIVGVIQDITPQKTMEIRLASNLERQMALMNGLPDAVVVYNERGEVNYLNPAFEETFGWSLDELAGKRIDFVPEESRQETAAALGRLAKNEKITRFVTRRLTRSRELLDVEISASRFADPDGKRRESVVILRDITRMKRVVAALRESEEKFRVIGESAQDAVIMMDGNGDVSYWNPAARKIFGYTEEEAAGRFLHGMIVPERYRDTFASAFERFRRSGEGDAIGRIVELKGLHKNGTEIPVELSLSAVMLKGGWHSIGMVRDISQRKAAEEKLRFYTDELETMVEDRTRALSKALMKAEEAKSSIDAIIRSISGGVVVSDVRNRVVMMNRESQKMLSTPFNESKVLHLPKIIPIRKSMKKDQESQSRMNGGRQFDFEVGGGENGSPRILRARMSIIRDPKGITGGVVVILNDVTWERETERMKNEFISMAAHELRTPLTSILGFSEILQHRTDLAQDEQRKYVRHIHEKAVALSGIVSNIIDISQLESGGPLELRKEMVEIDPLIAEVVEKIQGRNDTRRIELVLPPSGLTLELDRERILQVFENIIGNAVKFSPKGEDVCIEVIQRADDCRIVVRDHGIGMTKEQVKQMFQRFYRVDSSDSAREGTGLGMSMVKSLVETHGGKVWVESEYGKGTTVTVSMPIGASRMGKKG